MDTRDPLEKAVDRAAVARRVRNAETTILDLHAEIERLRAPWGAVDEQDWSYILGAIGYGGRDQFWRAVLTEMRAALEQSAAGKK